MEADQGGGDLMHSLADLKGIHFAPKRSQFNPTEWEESFYHPWNCQLPSCTVAFDTRLQAVFVRPKWAMINPALGVYDFSVIDDALDECAAAGKKMTMAVLAGASTPSWVFENGCVSLDAEYLGGDYTQPLVPVPHDETLLSAYNEMQIALAAHIKANATRWATLMLVKSGLTICGSEEQRLLDPEVYRFPDGFPDTDTPEGDDAAREYMSRRFTLMGYREEKVHESVLASYDVLASEFDDQYLGMAFIQGAKRFPENGATVLPDLTFPSNVLEGIVLAAAARYSGRGVFNNTTLTEANSDIPLYADIITAGGYVAYQMNAQQLGYRADGRPNDPEGVADAIQAAYDDGALFVEVHDGNIEEHKAELITGNALLRS